MFRDPDFVDMCENDRVRVKSRPATLFDMQAIQQTISELTDAEVSPLLAALQSTNPAKSSCA